jgi:hypothetical protein
MRSELIGYLKHEDFLVNAFPILSYVPDWVPGTGWKHTARKWREQKNEAINAPYEWAKQQIVGIIYHITNKSPKWMKYTGYR